MDGILIINKEKGFTSHDVVAKLRGIVHQRKIGHTGTLDPDAQGVLPVCLGKATKLCEFLTDKKKIYLSTVKLGIKTDTQDITGNIVDQKPVSVSKEELQQVLSSFLGNQLQIPPMYSAIKVNGTKLYELARKGIEVERKAREIQIDQIDLISFDEEKQEFSMRVCCSKGTYIRTLCNDVGERLGTFATMKTLLREQSGNFSLQNSLTLSQVEELVQQDELASKLISIEEVFSHFESRRVSLSGEKRLVNGNVLLEESLDDFGHPVDGTCYRIYNIENQFYALYRYSEEKACFRVEKMFGIN